MYFNCHTVFSFKYGTLSIEKLYAEAQRCGIRKIALTEINNTTSYIELLRLRAEKKQTHPELPLLDIAVGIEFRNEHDLQYIALAKNNNGFEKINRFLSYHNREEKEFPERAPEFEDVLNKWRGYKESRKEALYEEPAHIVAVNATWND